jgi:hypothetical protein
MDEGQMDGAIRFFSAFAQAVEILKRAAMDLGAHFLKRFGIGVRAGKAENLVPVGDQFLGCSCADKTGCAGSKYTHEKYSLFRRTGYWYSAHAGKVVILYGYNR